jgi:nitrate/nitrite-specific signal transduction histidine kinase
LPPTARRATQSPLWHPATKQQHFRGGGSSVASPLRPERRCHAPQRKDLIPDAVEAAIYYVVAESLTNAAKYANASEPRVELSSTNETVVVEIRDSGRAGADLSRGSGI